MRGSAPSVTSAGYFMSVCLLVLLLLGRQLGGQSCVCVCSSFSVNLSVVFGFASCPVFFEARAWTFVVSFRLWLLSTMV